MMTTMAMMLRVMMMSRDVTFRRLVAAQVIELGCLCSSMRTILLSLNLLIVQSIWSRHSMYAKKPNIF